ncbi:MAG: chemotaxis protein CheW, partial [Rhodothermaceae bacterium]|nr:chemotaxis protein CheW [Rhodothermaceae bacterium]
SAGFLGLDQLNQLAHHFEDVLNQLRRGGLAFHSDMLDIMFEAFDLMKVLQQQVIDMKLEVIDTQNIVKQLKLISEGKFEGISSSKTAVPQPTSAKPAAGKASKPTSKRSQDRSPETIRVEVERLDSLMNLVGELVLNRNRLVQIIDDVSHVLQEHDDLYKTMLDTSSQLDFITTELQTGVMHTRMVQVGRIFNKFPRVVRDLAKDANKMINLVIEGAETELDKSLTEEIGDPLVHLIRNSVDHGVEPPDVRTSNGKDPQGSIRLSAQHVGNNIVIEIEDDGKGMDPEKLKKKAMEKGLISDKEAAEMSDKDAFSLIFKAGFSTAEQVTKISGRGVGMDVVKTNIAKMNGTISINSELGVGTVITLKLPLTLAINQSLLVRQGDETFAIPLHSVIEVVNLNEQKIDSVNGQEVIQIRERILPLVRIGEFLDIPNSKKSEHAYAVIVGLAHHRIGLVADDLVGQKEIVIKPLGSYLKQVDGIAGSTILGDGHVIMILDVAQIIRSDKERQRAAASELEMAA